MSLQDCLKNRIGIVSILRGEDFTKLARFLNNRVLPHGSFLQQLEWGTDNPRFKAKLPACMHACSFDLPAITALKILEILVQPHANRKAVTLHSRNVAWLQQPSTNGPDRGFARSRPIRQAALSNSAGMIAVPGLPGNAST
ncbi:hypothetical protein [Accumulibacter sp.]|uniref:hypothetical protein n=1 Tax=Accumulibacter sp. TaxID=2053492 RepID=UPI002879F980|nr:hypothetical protein [Accumulibacter sp.]MDS4055021.1 hypothetical protein [Accumulibacter sp.]